MREESNYQGGLDARRNRRDQFGNSHVWTGIFIIIIGIAALIKISNPQLPHWIFSWKTFLVALGLFIGFKHNFRGAVWFILILIGSVFIATEIYPELSLRRYLWPIILIGVGAMIIFRPRSPRFMGNFNSDNDPNSPTGKGGCFTTQPDYKEDFVDSTSIFGGAKKNIISKNFKGGDLVNIFGGTELDLTRADFNGTAVIELTTIFGGTKLVVPSDWSVRSEAVTIFGGLEDKRDTQRLSDSPEKLLLLKGTIIFGGVEIKSF